MGKFWRGRYVETFIDARQQIEGEIHYFFVDVSRFLTYYLTETIIVWAYIEPHTSHLIYAHVPSI